MGGSKCNHCGLVNLASDTICRRCGERFAGPIRGRKPAGPRDRAKSSSRLWPLLALAVVGAAIYYVYSGAERSVQSVPSMTPGVPVTRSQQTQANAYKTAVQNSNGLAQGQKHTAEIEKMTRTK